MIHSLDLSFLPLSFNMYIKQICETAFFNFCSIAKIRSILSDAEKLFHLFITSTLD